MAFFRELADGVKMGTKIFDFGDLIVEQGPGENFSMIFSHRRDQPDISSGIKTPSRSVEVTKDFITFLGVKYPRIPGYESVTRGTTVYFARDGSIRLEFTVENKTKTLLCVNTNVLK